ncbi:hypothetical protein H0A71_18220 [Alcaligenaceae bacterium]|nr:hypothetical protein [Alcaligenaceae bacterium]
MLSIWILIHGVVKFVISIECFTHRLKLHITHNCVVRDATRDDLIDAFVPPESAAKLLRANVDLFAWIVTHSTKVAVDKSRELAETVGKSLRASAGSATGKAKARSQR